MKYNKETLDHWTWIVKAVLTAENNIGSYNLEKLKLRLITADEYCELVAKEILSKTVNDGADE